VPHVDVRSKLPEWLAPGASFAVQGFTGSRVVVEELIDGRPVARTRSGVLGRFTLRASAPGAGRHQVSVRVDGARVGAGTLVVLPARPSARRSRRTAGRIRGRTSAELSRRLTSRRRTSKAQ